MRLVTAFVAAIGVVQLAGGSALVVFRKMTTGTAIAVSGGALVVLAVMLVRLGRRGAKDVPAGTRPAPPIPSIEIPAWSRPVLPLNGDSSRRSATWALLETMRAEAIQAAKGAAAAREAHRHGPPPAMRPPE